MKQKCKYFFKREDGNILVLFASVLTILIFFIGLSLDVGMLFLRRNSMQSLCQMVREDRFTYQDSIRYASNPGLESYQIISDTMAANAFDGTVKVYFYEEPPAANYRYYRIRTELSDEYSFTFARLFGLDTMTLTVFLDGGETYGEGLSDVVWYPPLSAASYNGSYTSQPGGGYIYDGADLPSSW